MGPGHPPRVVLLGQLPPLVAGPPQAVPAGAGHQHGGLSLLLLGHHLGFLLVLFYDSMPFLAGDLANDPVVEAGPGQLCDGSGAQGGVCVAAAEPRLAGDDGQDGVEPAESSPLPDEPHGVDLAPALAVNGLEEDVVAGALGAPALLHGRSGGDAVSAPDLGEPEEELLYSLCLGGWGTGQVKLYNWGHTGCYFNWHILVLW